MGQFPIDYVGNRFILACRRYRHKDINKVDTVLAEVLSAFQDQQIQKDFLTTDIVKWLKSSVEDIFWRDDTLPDYDYLTKSMTCLYGALILGIYTVATTVAEGQDGFTFSISHTGGQLEVSWHLPPEYDDFFVITYLPEVTLQAELPEAIEAGIDIILEHPFRLQISGTAATYTGHSLPMANNLRELYKLLLEQLEARQ